MSLDTWEKEFYPVSAISIDTMPEAIEAALLKWTGRLPENMAKHGVVFRIRRDSTIEPRYIVNVDDIEGREEDFEFDGESCALCHVAESIDDERDSYSNSYCGSCPLAQIGNECDADLVDETGDEVRSVYSAAVASRLASTEANAQIEQSTRNMIAALEKAKAHYFKDEETVKLFGFAPKLALLLVTSLQQLKVR